MLDVDIKGKEAVFPHSSENHLFHPALGDFRLFGTGSGHQQEKNTFTVTEKAVIAPPGRIDDPGKGFDGIVTGLYLPAPEQLIKISHTNDQNGKFGAVTDPEIVPSAQEPLETPPVLQAGQDIFCGQAGQGLCIVSAFNGNGRVFGDGRKC